MAKISDTNPILAEQTEASRLAMPSRLKPDPYKSEREGYHEFCHPEHTAGNPCGSFEVFWHDKNDDDLAMEEPGWYWWTCFPGCMPDGESNGPFRTSYLAYVDARGGA